MSDSPQLISLEMAQEPMFWGVDVGGTGIKIGLVDNVGKTLAYEKLPTREPEGPTAAMQRVAAVLLDFHDQLGIGEGSVAGIGLGAPGPMDLPKGMLVAPPQLPTWWGFGIRDSLSKLAGLPVAFVNDANAAAYGEFWLGSGEQATSMVLLTLGTGVGGGIIVEGELINGVNSFGSECGHILVDPSPHAQICAWGGGRGQLEAYASASGVVMRTRQRLMEGATSSLSGLLGGGDSELTSLRIYHAAEAGDAMALEIIDETARWLGIGITTLVHTLDPGLIVLGGAMDFGGAGSKLGERFLQKIREEFKRRTFENVYQGTVIQFAKLGADAGYLGAAGYARKLFARA
ncbi:MAG: ROK family protein [Planctomycetaceae bacterium]